MAIKKTLLFITLFSFLNTSAFLSKQREYPHLKKVPELHDACAQISENNKGRLFRTNGESACIYFNKKFKKLAETGNSFGLKQDKNTTEFDWQTLRDMSTGTDATNLYYIYKELSDEQLAKISNKNNTWSTLTKDEKMLAVLRHAIRSHKKQLEKEWREKNNK